MSQLSKEDLARHLELALQGDPETLRRKLEILHNQLTAPPPTHPSRPRTRIEFVQEGPLTWRIRCSREDAKHAEELFADFCTRKGIDGEWKVEHRNGSPVVERFGSSYLLRFHKTPERKVIPRGKKGSGLRKNRREAIKEALADMNASDQKDLLDFMRRELFG